jgi:hypothetical protein
MYSWIYSIERTDVGSLKPNHKVAETRKEGLRCGRGKSDFKSASPLIFDFRHTAQLIGKRAN